jgi:mono/diheme cytochrome c family protein
LTGDLTRGTMNLNMAFKFVLIAALAAGCARAVPPPATPNDATWAANAWPGTTLADLEHGRQLYGARCAGCHLPVEPASIAASAWPGHVAEMTTRAHLGPTEAALVTRYLVALSSRPAR